MKVKQKNLRVFHIKIDDKDKFIEYFSKNIVLLKEFFLLIEGNIDETIIEILDNEVVCYKNISNCNLRLSSVKKEVEINTQEVEEKKEEVIAQVEPKENIKVYERPIRSGEEINEDLPVVVFGRINSGAKLFCSSSVSIYGTIDGLVQCDGDYIVINGMSDRGNLIFNGEIIEKETLKSDVLQKITLVSSKIVVKEI